MDVGCSVRVALAQRKKSKKWLSEQLGVSYQRVQTISRQKASSSGLIERLAAVFNLSTPEFIQLGEFEEGK